jgi:hypothetical protein
VFGKIISIGMVVLIWVNGNMMKVVMDGVCSLIFLYLYLYYAILLNIGNNEEQFYTNNRRENSRCELFPGSANGRLIIEARKVRYRNSL